MKFNTLRGLGSSENWGRFIENALLSADTQAQALRAKLQSLSNSLNNAVTGYNQQLQSSRAFVRANKSVYTLGVNSVMAAPWTLVEDVTTFTAGSYVTIASATLTLEKSTPAAMLYFSCDYAELRDYTAGSGNLRATIFVNGQDILSADPRSSIEGEPNALSASFAYIYGMPCMYYYTLPASEYLIEYAILTSRTITADVSPPDISVLAVPQA